ncbi:hypothetical protein MBLNU459_g6115t1 [Dothideomycetes sp. NU459]
MCNFAPSVKRYHNLEAAIQAGASTHFGRLEVTEHVRYISDSIFECTDEDGVSKQYITEQEMIESGGALTISSDHHHQGCLCLRTKQAESYREIARVEKGCCGRMMTDLAGVSWNRYTFTDGSTETDAEIRDDPEVESAEVFRYSDRQYLRKTYIGPDVPGGEQRRGGSVSSDQTELGSGDSVASEETLV